MEEEGASYSEQILECARRNNTELLLQIKAELNNDSQKLAHLINTTKETITNNSPLHLACRMGHWESIDIILDIEGVEVDPLNRDGDSPLHLAVKYCADEPEHGTFVVDNLLDAGADPRIVNSHGLKPIQLVTDNQQLRNLLEGAEYAISMEVTEAEQLAQDEDSGSASDSD
ncbi:Ankyrin repeat-containing protein [Meyerozyma sp. JA9]|nr:Ankyrin repeat-containing protein [Meyerozyma sp. JA9]